MPKKKQKTVFSTKNLILIISLTSVSVFAFQYFAAIQSQKNSRIIRVEEKSRYQEPTSTPIISVGQRYVSKSKKISFDVPIGWIIENEASFDNGVVITIQGPQQVLKIFEGAVPDHGFDDFRTQETKINLAGKSFQARKFISQSWGNAFIFAHIQNAPYELNIEYGDAASVGFRGFEQKSQDKVNFEKDIQPIENILKTFKY